MKKFILIFLVLVMPLFGCTMTPKYARPEFPSAPKWDDIPGYQTEAGQQAAKKLQWRAFFRDEQLRDVINTALENNRDLRLAALNIKEARALYRITRANVMPSVRGTGKGSYQNTSKANTLSGYTSDSDRYDANVGVTSYELDLFGRLRSENQAALNEYFATRAAKDVVRNSLIAETANAYLQFLADEKLVALSEETLDTQKRTHDLLSQSMQKGVATEQDVARARTALETAQVNLHRYRRLVEQDRNALILLMGVPHQEGLIPDADLAKINLSSLPVAMPSEVLLGRPDIRQAEFRLMARNADIGAARAAFFPDISLTGAYGFASRRLSDLFSGDALGQWSFVPELTAPIFTGGRGTANLDLAKIRKDKAVVQYEQVIRTAFREVSDDLAARATLTQELGAQLRLVDAAQRVYNNSEARYKAGVDSFLSVLDAQRGLYAARQGVIEIRRQRLSNLINLYKALGGDTGDDPASAASDPDPQTP